MPRTRFVSRRSILFFEDEGHRVKVVFFNPFYHVFDPSRGWLTPVLECESGIRFGDVVLVPLTCLSTIDHRDRILGKITRKIVSMIMFWERYWFAQERIWEFFDGVDGDGAPAGI